MFNWLQKLLKDFGKFLNAPTGNSFKFFWQKNWPAILILIIIVFVVSYIISKIFEIVVKIALTIFLIWFTFMLIFKNKELRDMFRDWGKNSQQTSDNDSNKQ